MRLGGEAGKEGNDTIFRYGLNFSLQSFLAISDFYLWEEEDQM